MSTVSNTKWMEEFVLALRMRDITGPAIGAAVNEAQSHLAETGEVARVAFGDPNEYANSLVFSDSATAAPIQVLPSLVQAAAFLVGWILLVPSAGALLRGDTQFTVRWGEVVAFVILVVAILGVVLGLRTLFTKPVVLGALFAGTMAAAVMVNILVRAAAFTLPALLVAIASAIVFAGGLIAYARIKPDVITDPVTGEDVAPEGRVLRLVSSPWAFVVIMLVLIVIEWQIGAR